MAAGRSSRFRKSGAGHKLLAPLHGKPLLQHSLANAHATGMDVFVITRPEDRQVHSLIGETRNLICASTGLGESIAMAVRASAEYDGWMISLADMPLIRPSSYLTIAGAMRAGSVVRMAFDGVPGHPVGFGKALYNDLVSLRGDCGPRSLMRSRALTVISTADRGCIEDIDTREDLARLEARAIRPEPDR